jgi:hypothetical protein
MWIYAPKEQRKNTTNGDAIRCVMAYAASINFIRMFV